MNDFDFKSRPRKLCESCAIYNTCKFYPKSCFEELPKNCNLSGWIFSQREQLKQIIRKKKEKIIEYNAIIPFVSKTKARNMKHQIEQMQNEIKKYSEFGSDNW